MQSKDDVLLFLIEVLKMKYSLKKEISSSSRLFHYLGLRGEDAVSFLSEVTDRYHIEWDDFDFDQYFKGEYYSPADIFNWLLGLDDVSREPLTIDHLASVCVDGKWRPPRAS